MKKSLLPALVVGTGIATASSLGLYFGLKSGFDDLDKALDELEQSVQEMSVSSEELLEATEDFARTLEEETAAIQSLSTIRPTQITDLCNNTFYWRYSLCENLALSDGTVLSIERDKASKHLIQSIDNLRSGKSESAFEKPLPLEEAEQILLYNNLG